MKKFLFLTVFAVLSLLSFAQPTSQSKKIVADKLAGVVGDRVILYSDIKNAIADYQRQGAEIPANAECMIMEQAIISKVMMLQAEKDSLPVTDEEVEAELEQRVRYFIQQYGTQQAVEELAGKTIYQIKDEARESVKEKKLAEAMQRKIVENVRITPTEVKAFFDRIPKDSLPFYESELEVGQIVVFPKASRDLEKYTFDELSRYRQQVLNNVVSFDQLAKRISMDPGSKDRGGQYQINRNEKTWDPAFMSAAFRLKEGEISPVIKSKFGYHIIKMVQRNGDEAVVQHILLIPPITDDEIKLSQNKLDTARAKIIAGTMNFNQAALKYSEDDQSKFAGPFFTGRDGSTYVTIDQLDKDIVAMISKMKPGEYSQPVAYTDERGTKAVRIIYFKSRSEPHRMNMKDDYNKIAQLALEEKKGKTLEKWLLTKLPTYYISIADDMTDQCDMLKKYNSKKNYN